MQDSYVLTYIAGYLAHKLVDKCCKMCSTKLCCQLSLCNPDHQLLLKKNYEGAKQGLVGPSEELVDVVVAFEKQYQATVQDVMVAPSVKAQLLAAMSKEIDLAWLACNRCHISNSVLYLLVNVRLHHTIRLANRNIVDNKDRRNRKTLKFSHM